MELWCKQQGKDDEGIFCTAHLHEGRAFNCPYANPEARLKAEYPCSDYEPNEDIVDKLNAVGCVYPATSEEISAAVKEQEAK